MSTIGLKVHLIPSAVASSAEIASSFATAAGSQLLASAIGTGKIVLYPWMTSRAKMTGMCSRDCRAACCTWLILATPPRDDLSFELCINRVKAGYVSNYLCDLPLDSVVEFKGPYGSFVVTQPI